MSDLLKSASPQRQILIAAIVSVVLGAAMVGVYLSFFQSRYDVLFSNLRDADAATIVAELDKVKAPYQLKNGGETILMPRELVAKTRLNLMSTSIPLKGTVGFELFNKTDMGLTEFTQSINYQRALQGELSRTIMAMDTVDQARIHLALPEHAIFRDESKPPKASVTIITRPGKQLAASTVRGIQRLVAAAIPDLDTANVVVLDGHGAVVSDGGAAASASPKDHKRNVEEAYETTLRDALQGSFAGRKMDIAVWAGLSDAQLSSDDQSDAPQSQGRSFPLRVVVTVDPPGSVAEERAIRNVVLSTIHADPNLGDVITYAVAARPAPASVAQAAPAPLRAFGPWRLNTGFLISIALMSLLSATALYFRRPSLRKLTERQRLDYARRLRTMLEGAEADGRA